MKTIVLACSFMVLTAQWCYGQMRCESDSTKRQRVLTSDAPNAFTCYMVMQRGAKENYGTGFLIHPRVLLTAGHNLANFPSGVVTSVEVFFGSVDADNYLISATIPLTKGENKFFRKNYWLTWKIRNDYAIVILPDSSLYKAIKGHYSATPVDAAVLTQSALHITGSPKGKALHEMWTDSTTQIEYNGNYIRYDMFTVYRNSGSPIWQRTESGYRAVGVHSRGYGTCGAATTLNEAVITQIRQWCRSAGVDF